MGNKFRHDDQPVQQALRCGSIPPYRTTSERMSAIAGGPGEEPAAVAFSCMRADVPGDLPAVLQFEQIPLGLAGEPRLRGALGIPEGGAPREAETTDAAGKLFWCCLAAKEQIAGLGVRRDAKGHSACDRQDEVTDLDLVFEPAAFAKE